LCGGFHEMPLLAKNQAEVVAGLGVIGSKADCRFERRPRAIDIAGPPSRRAKMILSVEETRLELDRAREVFECRVGLSELTANVPEAVVHWRKIRRTLQGTFVRVSRTGEVFGLFSCVAELDESLRRFLSRFWDCTAFLRRSGYA
jgi:hypothetical protein